MGTGSGSGSAGWELGLFAMSDSAEDKERGFVRFEMSPFGAAREVIARLALLVYVDLLLALSSAHTEQRSVVTARGVKITNNNFFMSHTCGRVAPTSTSGLIHKTHMVSIQTKLNRRE